MRWKYFVKIAVFGIIWIFVFSYLVFLSLEKLTDSFTLQENNLLFKYTTFKPIVQLVEDKNYYIDNKSYTTISSIKITPNFTLGELNVNEVLTLKYWDLVRNSNSTSTKEYPSLQSLWSKGILRNNLWRPKTPNGLQINDRNIQQLVYQMEASTNPLINKSNLKSILLWDGFLWWKRKPVAEFGEFGNHSWNFLSWNSHLNTSNYLQPSDCYETPGSITNCLFTQEKNKLNEVDAVIFTKDWLHKKDFSVPKNLLSFYYMFESPFHSYAVLNNSEQLLATYWRGSDVITPYRKWIYFDPKKKQIEQGNRLRCCFLFAIQEQSYHAGKSIPVAIFVSNCFAPNNRSGYIKELQKYIQVDVYGNCGNMTCDSSNGTKCNEMLKKDYYFYLAFENSNCRDYITEKFFHTAFNNDVIPVAFGAHPEDYKYAAPLNSYILVEDFKGPKQLAVYLKFLIQNSSEYDKYFNWKGTGQFLSSEPLCTFCAMVNYADQVPPPKRKVPFVWGKTLTSKNEQMCLNYNKWFWNEKN